MIDWSGKELVTIEKVGTKTDGYNTDNYKESIDFNLKHTTCKDMVRQILKQDKMARKDYTWLVIMTWIKQNAIKFIIPLDDYQNMYKPESITRIARELVEEAKNGDPDLKFLLNNEEVLEKRENLNNLNTEYYSQKNNYNLSKVIK